MTTVVIELDDAVYRKLEATAAAQQLTVAEVVQHAAEREASTLEPGVSPEVSMMMDEIIETYRPVFHRLAE